jgi:hypothetical protein
MAERGVGLRAGVGHRAWILRGLGDGDKPERGLVVPPRSKAGYGMVAPVQVVRAVVALFLDVGDLPSTGEFEIPADDTAAGQRGETEEPDETHD